MLPNGARRREHRLSGHAIGQYRGRSGACPGPRESDASRRPRGHGADGRRGSLYPLARGAGDAVRGAPIPGRADRAVAGREGGRGGARHPAAPPPRPGLGAFLEGGRRRSPGRTLPGHPDGLHGPRVVVHPRRSPGQRVGLPLVRAARGSAYGPDHHGVGFRSRVGRARAGRVAGTAGDGSQRHARHPAEHDGRSRSGARAARDDCPVRAPEGSRDAFPRAGRVARTRLDARPDRGRGAHARRAADGGVAGPRVAGHLPRAGGRRPRPAGAGTDLSAGVQLGGVSPQHPRGDARGPAGGGVACRRRGRSGRGRRERVPGGSRG